MQKDTAVRKRANTLQKYLKSYKKGDVFFFEGDPGNEMYIIQNGSVVVSKRVQNMDRELAVLKSGDFFGEMSLLLQRERSATVKAKEDTTVLVIKKVTFTDMLRENGQVAAKIIEGLAERLRTTDERLKDSLEERIFISLLTIIEDSALHGRKTQDGKFLLTDTVEDISRVVGLPIIKVDEVLKKLEKSGLLRRVQNTILLEDWKTFMEFKKTYITKLKP